MRRHLNKAVGLTLGVFFLILAVIGLLLPLIPATPFALLSAYFFSKYSPTIHQWLLGLPYLGPAIQEWSATQVIRPRAKLMAIICMSFSFILVTLHPLPPAWAKITASAILICIAIFILTRKSRAN